MKYFLRIVEEIYWADHLQTPKDCKMSQKGDYRFYHER